MKAGQITAAKDKLAAVRDVPTAEARANCRWLSGLCDGAHSRDGAGWSRWDRDLGTRLAELPEAQWGPVDLDHGRRLSHKYRKQLVGRPPLHALETRERYERITGMVQRLTGADSVEVIDADKMEEPSEATNSASEAVPIRATDDRVERVPAAGQPADRQGSAAPRDGDEQRMAGEIVSRAWSQKGTEEKGHGGPMVDGGQLGSGANGITLDESQRQALDLIRRSPVAILTGGPGTGKTTITRRLVTEALADGRRVAAMAPTGIAAKRLAESIDFPASTIHRALGAVPLGDGIITVTPEARDATAAADW